MSLLPHDRDRLGCLTRAHVFMYSKSCLLYLQTDMAAAAVAAMAGKKQREWGRTEQEEGGPAARRGRSSRNHSRENKHQIAYSVRGGKDGRTALLG